MSSYSYNQELAYLDSIITIVIISIAVEGEINHLLRMWQKFPGKWEALIIGEVSHAI